MSPRRNLCSEGLVWVLGMGLGLAMLASCPVLAQDLQRLNRMSLPTAEEIEQSARPETDPVVVARVQGVVSRLLQAINEPGYAWRVTVLASPVPNAYALPNGYLYVHTGLLALGPPPPLHPLDPTLPVPPTLTDDELAFILGHEMAHVTHGHMVRLQNAGRGVNGITRVGGMSPSLLGVLARQTLQKVVTSGFSREYEAEADEWGVRYSTLAGYDAGAALLAFERLRGYELSHPVAAGLFANHPPTAERSKQVRALIAATSQTGLLGTTSGAPNPKLPLLSLRLPAGELQSSSPVIPKPLKDPRLAVGVSADPSQGQSMSSWPSGPPSTQPGAEPGPSGISPADSAPGTLTLGSERPSARPSGSLIGGRADSEAGTLSSERPSARPPYRGEDVGSREGVGKARPVQGGTQGGGNYPGRPSSSPLAWLGQRLGALRDCCNLRLEDPASAPELAGGPVSPAHPAGVGPDALALRLGEEARKRGADVRLELDRFELKAKRMPWPGGFVLRLELGVHGYLWQASSPGSVRTLEFTRVREAMQEATASGAPQLQTQVLEAVGQELEMELRRVLAQETRFKRNQEHLGEPEH